MSLIARITSLSRRDRITSVGMALTGGWLFLVALFWLLAPGGDGGAGGIARLVVVAGVVLPLALIWLGVSLARQLAILRADAEELRLSLSVMRAALPNGDEIGADDLRPGLSQATPPRPEPARSEPARSEPERSPAATDRAPASAIRPARAATTPPPAQAAAKPRATPDQRQAALRFDPQGGTPVDPGTLIRALNFPDGPDDHDAIEALRDALKDPAHSRVLRAAQDVVTLLAGQDVYMDDLPPDPARPDVWRRFAEGDRGSAVAALGGIHQPQALEIAAAMLRGDEVFRDAAHHFLRHFDTMIAGIVPQLDDMQIAVLADSRSARAFMLLGRVSGVFG
ncbi:hypothetical protein PANO111632_16015 [Paracoccus nototheniae]|uniref:Uncharacterized protein n=1 Tax=Paracoccus nototheniae TaxID=2489002 RepID=A0ABW4DSJ5_9RHOB|nr:hypothetical protein [Paracoccus nototheniae]